MKYSYVYKIVTSILLTGIVFIAIPRSVAAQDITVWRDYNSTIRKKVSKLSNEKIESMPVPILFGVTQASISKNFGQIRSNGKKHEGLDIFAPLGAPIITPTDTVILKTGYGAASGNYVYTANPGGETFAYMHLSKIGNIHAGDTLEKGALIGYVGKTGNVGSASPHLHLEIRNSSGPTDPRPRLTEVLSFEQQIEYLEKIFEDGADAKKEIASTIVSLYKKELTQPTDPEIELPEAIKDVIENGPVIVTTTVKGNTVVGNLSIGSRGDAVKVLQEFLKQKGVGSGAAIVPDGSFGPATKRALAEYQKSVGLSADGSYGPMTRAFVEANS